MKKAILIGAVLAAALPALGQGTVSVKNLFSATDQRYIFNTDGTSKLSKAVGRIEVLYNGAVISSVTDGTGNGLAVDGIFALGVLTVPGVAAGGNATITIRAWDNSTGSTFAAATSKGSEDVSVTGLGGGTVPPASISGFSSFSLSGGTGPVTPEPSTYALAALGLGGLLLASRKK